LDLAAIALPAGFGESGLPFGISLIAPAFRDSALLDLGTRFQQIVGLPLRTAKV
jgi:allophanate hydrolase